VNLEYGWVKYTCCRTSKGFEAKLTDHPEIVFTASSPREALWGCFVILGQRLRFKTGPI
jgi:hypothetical protein